MRPTISRIDHDGDYEFGNIKLEEHVDNCVLDTIRRHGAPGKKCAIPVEVIDAITGRVIAVVKSGVEASRLTGVAPPNIAKICKRRGRARIGKGFTFQYAKERAAV